MDDEIICPECGRPNLPEAEKCWYCQKPLEKPSGEFGSSEQTSEEIINISPGNNPQPGDGPPVEEDIPEWLKRVRELKQADQTEEEEEDQWRQQILFTGVSDKEPVKKARKPEPRSTKKNKPAKSVEPPSKSPRPTLKKELQREEPPSLKSDHEDESEEGQDELPDGFTPLDTKEG